MRERLVWECAYGRENAILVTAWTEKGARRRYRKVLGFLGALSWEEIGDAAMETARNDVL